MSVFAYEKGEGSVRNFSDWLVEESRIEQPDSSYRGESVDVRNGIDPCIKYLIAGGSSIHGRGRLSFEDRSNKRKRTHNYGTRWHAIPCLLGVRQEWVDFHYLKRSAKSCDRRHAASIDRSSQTYLSNLVKIAVLILEEENKNIITEDILQFCFLFASS